MKIETAFSRCHKSISHAQFVKNFLKLPSIAITNPKCFCRFNMRDFKIELFIPELFFPVKSRFSDAIMVLLPQLEHCLRRVYACCNNLPERLQTAESSEFYTTFNEVRFYGTLRDKVEKRIITFFRAYLGGA